jgi:hypothetical protein
LRYIPAFLKIRRSKRELTVANRPQTKTEQTTRIKKMRQTDRSVPNLVFIDNPVHKIVHNTEIGMKTTDATLASNIKQLTVPAA